MFQIALFRIFAVWIIDDLMRKDKHYVNFQFCTFILLSGEGFCLYSFCEQSRGFIGMPEIKLLQDLKKIPYHLCITIYLCL